MQIAVASGKGGTGKTTVAVSLFHFLGNCQNKKVHLVDCDVEEPNDALFLTPLHLLEQKKIHQYIPEIDTSVCTFCKKCVDWCEFNAITIIETRKFAEVDASLCHSCGACLIACPENAFTEKPHPLGTITRYDAGNGKAFTEGRLEVGSAMQTMLIKKLKSELYQNGVIQILDAPPGTSCPVVETISDVDYVILVTEPTPFGLHDMKIMVELLTEIQKPFGVVVNKAGLGSQEVYTFIRENNMELLGKIPFSKEFAGKYSSGALINEFPEEWTDIYHQMVHKLSEKIRLS